MHDIVLPICGNQCGLRERYPGAWIFGRKCDKFDLFRVCIQSYLDAGALSASRDVWICGAVLCGVVDPENALMPIRVTE